MKVPPNICIESAGRAELSYGEEAREEKE